MIKVCSRCNLKVVNQLEIKTSDLSDDTKKFLDKTYYSFLCNNCLLEINDLVNTAKNDKLDTKNLIENIHYYKENGNFVFKEYYHILRGFCCQNKCRHCAYGY